MTNQRELFIHIYIMYNSFYHELMRPLLLTNHNDKSLKLAYDKKQIKRYTFDNKLFL